MCFGTLRDKIQDRDRIRSLNMRHQGQGERPCENIDAIELFTVRFWLEIVEKEECKRRTGCGDSLAKEQITPIWRILGGAGQKV